MARKRMIDPNIWESEDFSYLNNLEKIIFIGIFSLADDEGYGRANPKFIRNSLFPYNDNIRTSDIEKSLYSIAAHMSVVFYQAEDGKQYYCLKNWSKWQAIQKPTASIIPKPTTLSQYLYSSNTVGLQPNRKEKNEIEKEENISIMYTADFLKFWSSYPRHTSKSTAFNAFKKIKDRKKLLPQMLKAIELEKQSSQWQQGTQFIPLASTWLNQRRWEDETESTSLDSNVSHM